LTTEKVISFSEDINMKTTIERIEIILEDIDTGKYNREIIKNQLESLVLQAKIEQLEEKETK